MITSYEIEARRRISSNPSFVRFLAVTAKRRCRNMTEAVGAIKALTGAKNLSDLQPATSQGRAWERLIISFSSWMVERPIA